MGGIGRSVNNSEGSPSPRPVSRCADSCRAVVADPAVVELWLESEDRCVCGCSLEVLGRCVGAVHTAAALWSRTHRRVVFCDARS